MPEEIKHEVVLKTQKSLGKYVKKPPLSDKLLKKPPFRFLHDVINTVIKETGFLKGLFSEEELNSEKVKEKDAKLAFLSKLIDAVKALTNTNLAVRPSKIIAGLEPTETNLLLQAIAKAIEKKVDSTEYINKLQSGQIITNEKNKKTKKPAEKNDKVKKTPKTTNANETKTRPSKTNEKQVNNETPKSTDRDKNKTRRTSKETKSKPDSEEVKTKTKEKSKKKDKVKEIVSDDVIQTEKENVQNAASTLDAAAEVSKINAKNAAQTAEISNNEANSNRSVPDEDTIKISVEGPESSLVSETKTDNETKKRSTSASRPKSARPRSGDLKDKVIQEESREPVHIQSRPKSSLRPPSVRPSSARPGAPRLRPDSALPIKEIVPMGKINVIVENFDKDDEEETVIIQSNPEVVEEHVDNISDVPRDNKGHLVEQILEQINESEVNKVSTTENEWQKDIFYGKDSTTKETNNLRSLIQTLTKTANPLGKLLNYLHEDIDAMHAELESWTHTKRQLSDEIDKQRKISAEKNKPLVLQLEHLNQEIRKIEDELVITRNNILRNDAKIKELLSK